MLEDWPEIGVVYKFLDAMHCYVIWTALRHHGFTSASCHYNKYFRSRRREALLLTYAKTSKELIVPVFACQRILRM